MLMSVTICSHIEYTQHAHSTHIRPVGLSDNCSLADRRACVPQLACLCGFVCEWSDDKHRPTRPPRWQSMISPARMQITLVPLYGWRSYILCTLVSQYMDTSTQNGHTHIHKLRYKRNESVSTRKKLRHQRGTPNTREMLICMCVCVHVRVYNIVQTTCSGRISCYEFPHTHTNTIATLWQ